MKNIVIALVILASSALAQDVKALSGGQNVNLEKELLGKVYVPKGKQGKISEGTNVAFAYGMSATAVVKSDLTLVIPASIAAIGSPVLLKVNPSAKDNARIIRGKHIRISMTKSPINPLIVDILEIEQEQISVKLEVKSNGDVAIIPTATLAVGEYVLVFETNQELQSFGWEFKIQ